MSVVIVTLMCDQKQEQISITAHYLSQYISYVRGELCWCLLVVILIQITNVHILSKYNHFHIAGRPSLCCGVFTLMTSI